jgi:hypothetical protein
LAAALREGRTTSDLDGVVMCVVRALVLAGEGDLFRLVVGLNFPFLKKGTLICSVEAIVVRVRGTNFCSDSFGEHVFPRFSAYYSLLTSS